MATEYKLRYDPDDSDEENYICTNYTLKMESDKLTLNFLGIKYSNILSRESLIYSNEHMNIENIVEIFKNDIPDNIDLIWKDKHPLLFTKSFEIEKSKGFLGIYLYNEDIQILSKDNMLLTKDKMLLTKSNDELIIENNLLKDQIEELKKINISNSIEHNK
jgi:hypothetical protein